MNKKRIIHKLNKLISNENLRKTVYDFIIHNLKKMNKKKELTEKDSKQFKFYLRKYLHYPLAQININIEIENGYKSINIYYTRTKTEFIYGFYI